MITGRFYERKCISTAKLYSGTHQKEKGMSGFSLPFFFFEYGLAFVSATTSASTERLRSVLRYWIVSIGITLISNHHLPNGELCRMAFWVGTSDWLGSELLSI